MTVSGLLVTKGHSGRWPQWYFVPLELDAIEAHCKIHLVYICEIFFPKKGRETR